MIEQQKSKLEYMMYYGALLGAFWIFQYLFFIGESYWVHFIYFYHLLNIVSPLLMYIFYLRYRSQTPNISHSVWGCILFVTMIAFFGSIFEAAIRYAHFAIINPDVFANIAVIGVGVAESALKEMEEKEMLAHLTPEQIVMISDKYTAIVTSKAPYIISYMLVRIFQGFTFSLLIALFTRKR